MQRHFSTSRQKSRPKTEPHIPKESELELSEDEITRLTSIIVPFEACAQVYDTDEIALALIRLVAGLAGEGHRHNAAFLAARGCFRRTLTHNIALDDFMLEAMLLNGEKLRAMKSEEERVKELQEMRERAR
jgi:hypothetical protein